MAKLPKQVPVRYIGTKDVEENVVAGLLLRWTPRQVQFVTREQAGFLLFYPTQYEDARTEDDKRKHGPIVATPPHDHRYDEQDQSEEGTDVMPLVDVKLLDARGLVHFAGTYLGKRLDVNDSLKSLREQVNQAVEGKRFEYA